MKWRSPLPSKASWERAPAASQPRLHLSPGAANPGALLLSLHLATLSARTPPAAPPRRRVLNQWVSRFDLWPYLERFTIDATKEILAEMGGKVRPM